jgi:hypothetical protein
MLSELNKKNKFIVRLKKGGHMKKNMAFLVSGILIISVTSFNAWSQDMKNMNPRI